MVARAKCINPVEKSMSEGYDGRTFGHVSCTFIAFWLDGKRSPNGSAEAGIE
jgi:hypothetical protein